MIPYGRQDITEDDINSVIDVLKSDFLTQGPMVPQFEKLVTNYVGANHGVAVNSATSALHIACMALRLSDGDILWTSPVTFVASSNCGIYCGAKIDFVDIDPMTYNMCPKALEEKLIQAKVNGCLPKIVIPVHLTGQPCDMEQIFKLSKKYGFKIIEDASHAIGGKYKEDFIGSCQYSDITVFSFHPVKIITTCEGGMAVTNQEDLAASMNLYRAHGITRNKDEMINTPDGPWSYEQIEIGFNYRMTDIQAALGCSQIKRLEKYIQLRHKKFHLYNKLLKDLPVILPWQAPESYSAMHLYVIRLRLDTAKLSHKEFFEKLRDENIGVNLHYIPVYRHPFYQKFGYLYKDFPNAESYYSEAISLPMFANLSEEDISYISATIKKLLDV